ncbi:MAG TPA: hypothetical protein VMN78_09170 [Longimicrobiales bacterium]|nr:hypothetical protein [Longimicrobiales bacterium]
MVTSDDAIADAIRGAYDAAGICRLLVHLGYELVAPPDGIPFDDAGEENAALLPLERRHVASGGGIAVVCVVERDESSHVVRTTRLRGMLGGGPRPVLLLWPTADLLTVASGGLDGRPRALSLSRVAPRPVEIETLRELAVRDDGPLAALARHGRALDRSALTRRFFRDFRAQRDAVSSAWIGLPARARADRDQLALLFLSRLVFLYFLQKQGQLLGRDDYLIDRVRAAALHTDSRSIFHRVFEPLFFGVLNTPTTDRSADARALGDLPYLNGGLFEPHALERAHAGLDLPDPLLIGAFEQLLERYRFTSEEERGVDARAGAQAIQPEMLGRMFEGLMAADRRGATGTFYTPAAVVDRIVRRALQGWLAGRPGMDWRAAGLLLRERPPRYGGGGASVSAVRAELLESVRGLRVLDPACGSGAFVLGSLERLASLRRVLGDHAGDEEVRRDLAANALHGVDAEADAALLCALRVWLALTPRPGTSDGAVRPLPNLDHRVRQGDALLDPMDLAGRGDAAAEVWQAAALDPRARRARRLLSALVRRYGSASAGERDALRARLARCEVRLARRWIEGALHRLEVARRSLHARVRARDLFGGRDPDRRAWRVEAVRLRQARAELRRLDRRVRDEASLPFFSFGVHFADGEADAGSPSAGFDVLVSNPPWVRSHKWPRAFSSTIRSRYRVCREPGWRPIENGGRAPAAGQVDLALLFVERGLELLRPGGVMALLLPTKSFRSLSAGGARALVTERADILAIEDHSLDHRAIFRADAFAGLLVARRIDPVTGSDNAARDNTDPTIRITMSHRASAPLHFRARRAELTLVPGEPRAPWLIVPPDVRDAMRRMRARGLALGVHSGLRARRGAMTGANEMLLFERAERKLGDAVVAWRRRGLESSGAGGADGESALLRIGDLCPVVRGSGIRPFRYATEGWIAWCHNDATAAPREPSARLARYLAPLEKRLRARAGWRPGLPDAVLFRLDAAMLTPRVAWRDIACDLEVVRLPARAPALATQRPLVALNTVYFISVQDDAEACALTALLGSLPSRVFARSIAERAKDGHFRFFAWTVSAIPLPCGWREPTRLTCLADLGERAHAAAVTLGHVPEELRTEMDERVSELFGLPASAVDALRRFDRWLAGTGEPVPHLSRKGCA